MLVESLWEVSDVALLFGVISCVKVLEFFPAILGKSIGNITGEHKEGIGVICNSFDSHRCRIFNSGFKRVLGNYY